jgi:hypothetical protein
LLVAEAVDGALVVVVEQEDLEKDIIQVLIQLHL